MSYAPELLAAPRTPRYEITGLLGRGGTSFVYKALDKEKNFLVALKSLRFAEVDDIYHLKQEFRFFRDIYHHNLVLLYDLTVADATCFYTMELINGTDFVSFVRSNDGALRACLDQLVDGLSAIHQVGRLHRDLKPSNILVEADGRTVLLDFGLSAELRSTNSVTSQAQLYAGTPAYMAPERLAGEPASAASDAYALGVILYQALTGVRPYPDLPPVAQHKAQQTRPPPPSRFRSDLPQDLGSLTLALLAFDPRERPPISEVKRLAHGSPLRSANFAPVVSEQRNQLFVGRELELSRLESAFLRTLEGRAVTVHVRGVSGVGKTTLVERFLAGVRYRSDALVLRSRCHHQESVRFNVLDGLIDALSRHLMVETKERLSQLDAPNLPTLVAMFPVLGRVPFPFDEFVRDSVPSDPQTIVREALGVLRELLRRVAAGRPLILWVDDLQWSDASSLPLLRDIGLADGDTPTLRIFSYRMEYAKSTPFAASLDGGATEGGAWETEFIDVQPLERSAIGALVSGLLEGAPTNSDWVNEVANQSAGLPFFVVELAAYRSQWSGGINAVGGETGAHILDQRLRALSTPQRAVLELVSVAGAPIAEATLIRVAAHEAGGGREIYQLLNQRILRRTDVNGEAAIETYHDRIRVATVDSLDAGARRLRHREIAEELASVADPDHPRLVEHYLGADEPTLAAEHAISAGRRARERFAFDQAAEFLLLALRLRGSDDGDPPLTVEIADTLADAGRSAESGDLFMRAAAGRWSDQEAMGACEALAAQQFLYSGRLTESYAVYRKLFTSLGIVFPATAGAAFRMSLTNRILFSVGLPRLKVRSASERPAPQALTRVDTLWAAAKGVMMMDYVVGDAIFTCYVREAAALGERSRVLRALAVEAAVLTNLGRPWSIRRGQKLIRRAEELARYSSDPYDQFVLHMCRSGIALFLGRWQEASELAQEAIARHRRDCVRYDFMVSAALAYRVTALAMAGAIRQAKAETLEAIDDGLRRGDLYVSRLFKSGYAVYIALAEDSPNTAVADAAVLLNDVPSDHFTSMHWSHFIATANALVYADRAWDAWSLVQQQWMSIRATGFLKLGFIGAHMREIRARAALAVVASGPPAKTPQVWTSERLLALAEEDARIIARTGPGSYGVATAAAIRSGIAAIKGEPLKRRVLLATARQNFEEAGMRLHRAAAEMQLATIAPGGMDDGRSGSGMQTMDNEGVRRPDRMSAFLMFVRPESNGGRSATRPE